MINQIVSLALAVSIFIPMVTVGNVEQGRQEEVAVISPFDYNSYNKLLKDFTPQITPKVLRVKKRSEVKGLLKGILAGAVITVMAMLTIEDTKQLRAHDRRH